ncbi:MAG: bifunctional [glutamate--ammonia ligase]-adenylyl-L-tyrosine phosphorylase/[glutamate--ammonia-ligase] adenylyltransferase [Polyangiaceae bacterium]
MISSRGLVAYAERLDPEATKRLHSDLLVGQHGDAVPGRALGVVLGVAYPPLAPVHGWQIEALDRIAQEGWSTPRTGSEMTGLLVEQCGDLEKLETVRRGLRRASWAERARIALREVLPRNLGGARIEDTAHELSLLAEVLFEVALAEATQHVAGRFGEPFHRPDASGQRRLSGMLTLGMGKLGGYELNCGSDIDVIFIYDSDDGGSELSVHEHWTRVARRAVASLEEFTEDGNVWRVDLRLRPEGSRGALVNSVAAAERYYETWGRLWERAAMLRARPIAGDRELGAQFEREVILPFVYRRRVDPSLATSMIELVLRSRAELSEAPERDLKLGEGGIREAEFFVQALQLIWGGQEPSLRISSFARGLERLRACGLVSDREVRDVGEAYWLLRRLEHAVQWYTGLQTHLIPTQSDRVEHLAKVLGFDSASSLNAALFLAREAVAEHFAGLAPEAPRPPSNYQAVYLHLDAGGLALEKAVAETLGSDDVAQHLEALARLPAGLLGPHTRERHPELGDNVLDAITESADPELAARGLRSFFQRFRDASAYIRQLAESPQTLRRFVTVLGASQFVSDALVARPDLADLVLFAAEDISEVQARQAVRAEVAEFEHWQDLQADFDAADSREELVGALRRARSRVMVRVAVADLAGEIGTRQATRLLSALADEVLQHAVRFELSLSAGGARLEQADQPPRGLAVIALGKLGGRDIGYGSDLDVLFVYDPEAVPDGHDAAHFYSRTAQRVIRLISAPHASGPGYELDTRLRPSGSQGLLVTNVAAFARYHRVNLEERPDEPPRSSVVTSGAAWERQALLRARFCAGDVELGKRLLEVAEVAAYEAGPPEVSELHRLRMRMQNELADERGGRRDLKMGRGGLLDVEFAVQWLQMKYGRDRSLRTPDTLLALSALERGGYLSREAFKLLKEAYRFLRRLEQRIHVRRGTSSTTLDPSTAEIEQLARRMGFRSAGSSASGVRPQASEQLLAEYERVTEQVRRTYLSVLGVEE